MKVKNEKTYCFSKEELIKKLGLKEPKLSFYYSTVKDELQITVVQE